MTSPTRARWARSERIQVPDATTTMSTGRQSDPSTPVDPDPELVSISFSGDGAEYFRLWVVNLLLTALTLGVYSAWAKVRKTKYFYQNTRLDGNVFDYHGRPGAI